MKLVKRSKFCSEKKAGKGRKGLKLSDIPQGAVFRATLGDPSNAPQVWMKTNEDSAVCIGAPDAGWDVGHCYWNAAGFYVLNYELLDATIVTED